MRFTILLEFLLFLWIGPSIYYCKLTPLGSSNIYNTPNSLRKPSTSPLGSSASKATSSNPKRRPLSEYSIYSLYTQNSPSENDRDSKLAQEREQLYEAYNLLHTLAQDFQKPFDAPAVIVVGHQTSGKSALIEALMGFQFNQVGGGTKTRRPIALRMQYNPNCIQPLCFLTLENGKEEQRSLADIQAYIESENKRLERDSTRSFDPREINIRMEYRYCPNMIVIDTPGMIHPPKGRQLTPQQRALAMAAREAENLVLSKIRCQDYIILCVEDTTDWKHATTRNVVMQADPNLERTVLVTTKLDTKLPQFSEADDLEDFLKAPLIHTLFMQMLGGPFFTTVPSGRVGITRGFENNEAFVYSVQRAERSDRSFIFNKLGRNKATDALGKVGVSRLRAFLEQRIEDSYRRNVAKIVPTLQNELRHTENKLQTIEEELKSLSLERLHQMANVFREKFAKELSQIIQGTVRINPEEWGESLETEQTKGGVFITPDQLSPEVWQHILETEVGNSRNKLLGGAQYHRAIREFTIAVRHMASPPITEDEISNAAGMTDTHNGINFMRAACVIAMEKAEVSFDPILESLHHRAEHVMKRIFPMVIKLLERSMQHTPMDINNRPFQEVLRRIYENFVEKTLADCVRICREDLYGMTRFVTWDVEDKSGSSHLYRLLPTPHRMVEVWQLAAKKIKKQKQIQNSVEEEYEEEDSRGDEEEEDEDTDEDEEQNLEQEVLAIANNRGNQGASTTNKNPVAKLFDWNNNKNNNNANNKKKSSASDDRKNSNNRKATNTREIQSQSRDRKGQPKAGKNQIENKLVPKKSYAIPSAGEEDAVLSDYYKVMQLTEEMLSGSSPSRTSALVTSLVQFIISSWRNHFARSTAMKFNCYFLMPFLDKFPVYLRDELDRLYKDGMAEMFDITETRKSLMAQKASLSDEREANIRLLQRFNQIAAQLKSSSGNSGAGSFASQPLSDEEEEELIDQSFQQQQQEYNLPENELSSPSPPPPPSRKQSSSSSPSSSRPSRPTSTLNAADINELDDLYSTSFAADTSNISPNRNNNNNNNRKPSNTNNRSPRSQQGNNNNSNNRKPSASNNAEDNQ